MIADRKNREIINNMVMAVGMVLSLFFILSLLFDFYYDLNDDFLIRDIVSGRYSGEPEGRTNQMMYALGIIVALGYRLFPGIPVFSLFLSLSLGIAFYMIYYRSLCCWKSKRTKIAGSLILVIITGVFLIKELVCIQYTAVSGILCAASCFWFLTTPYGLNKKEFWQRNFPALLSMTLAFAIRSEMALLCMPFVGACGFIHWMEEAGEIKKRNQNINPVEKEFFGKNMLLKYPLFLVCLLGMVGILMLIEAFAYRNYEWKEFREFFNARTKVYDYTWYPSYEKEEDFYKQNGISKIQYELIDNYNFGLDETITAETLEIIAEFNEKEKHIGGKEAKVKNFIRDMIQLPLNAGEMPYNIYVAVAYLLLISLAILQRKKWSYGWKIGILILVRTISWVYIVWAQRIVERISHPLYFIEFIIIMSFIIKEVYDRPLWNPEKYYRTITAVILVGVFSLCFMGKKAELNQEMVKRENVLQQQSQLELYTKIHPENYYYIDVYSMVDFTAKLYENIDNSKRNYDFLGGWICKSPLQEKAKKEYLKEETSIAEALLEDNFYFIIKEQREPAFLEKYYKEKGMKVELKKIDQIDYSNNPFLVYQLIKSK